MKVRQQGKNIYNFIEFCEWPDAQSETTSACVIYLPASQVLAGERLQGPGSRHKEVKTL